MSLDPSFVATAPTIVTSIGIFGTFVGIFAGLLDFDVKDIDKSVPPLLEGLKIAFVTSILGLASATLLKLAQFVMPGRQLAEGVGPDQIHNVLSEIRDDQKSSFAELRGAISGEGDSSVVTQVQKLRTTVSDGQAEFIREFRQFAEKMAEDGSKALIEALENVIRDFNTKISEQFGDNFRQLNEAVGQLLQWQENHKSQVEALTKQFMAALAGVEATRVALRDIADNAERIPQATAQVSEVIAKLQLQIENLESHLEAFQHLRTQAGEALPLIESNLAALTTRMKESQEQVSRELQEGAQKMHDQMERTIDDTTQLLGKQLETLDKQMQDEVQRVVETMGRQLAALSNRFVEDYTPLTEKLQRVVEMAKPVKGI